MWVLPASDSPVSDSPASDSSVGLYVGQFRRAFRPPVDDPSVFAIELEGVCGHRLCNTVTDGAG